MRAGVMDRRITIRRLVPGSVDAFNAPVETWADLVTVWAQRTDASASESYRAQEVGAQIDTRFLVRWSTDVADVNPCDRVQFDGLEYNIVAVRDVGRKISREIDAVARAEARTDAA